MIELVTAWGTAKVMAYVGGSIATFILLWIFRKIDNESISKKVELFFYGLGVAVTVGLSKWKYTAKIWNKTVEPFAIDLVDNIILSALSGFIRGLRSDDQE